MLGHFRPLMLSWRLEGDENMIIRRYLSKTIRVIFHPLITFSFLFHLSNICYSQVVLDGSIGPNSGPVSGGTLPDSTYTDYLISDDLGEQVGNNLFHSFSEFSIETGKSATFTGPDAIENVISRVTGGDPSNIDGLLQSTINDANLYLLNPSGVLFGPNASLDVNGSFHVSTADYLRFEDGAKLYANLIETSVLSVSSPVAFGFLGTNPAPVTVENTTLQVPENETLSIIAGDIEITGAEEIQGLVAPSGRINLASVRSSGEVIPNASGGASDLVMDSFTESGTITLSGVDLEAGGAGGGVVMIRSGRLVVDFASIKASSSESSGTSSNPGIDIQVEGDVTLDNGSEIDSNVFEGIEEDSGDIQIVADHLELNNFSQINSVGFAAVDSEPASIGDPGAILITTNSLMMDNGSRITSGTGGAGNGGIIQIHTNELGVHNASMIYSVAFGGTGNGGDIDITADSIFMSNEQYLGYGTGIMAQTGTSGVGDGGDVRVYTNSLEMNPGTEISASTKYAGQGGDVEVTVTEEASITGTRSLDLWGYDVYTGIFANTMNFSGNGGKVSITADSLILTTRASVQSCTFWNGTGDSGGVSIDARNLEILDSSAVFVNAYYGSGGADSGDVHVTADNITIIGPEDSDTPFTNDFTGISTLSGPYSGDGGDVYLSADNLMMTNWGNIVTGSMGAGKGGDIAIDVESVELFNGAAIVSSGYYTGDGGDVLINAGYVSISGVNPEVFVNNYGQEAMNPSAIASQAGYFTGSAGDVTINAETLELLDGGRLTTETFGDGIGGILTVNADHVNISGFSLELLSFHGADLESDVVGYQAGVYSSSHGSGDAGSIHFSVQTFDMSNRGLISAETDGDGLGGNVEILVNTISLTDNSLITARGLGSGDSGFIEIHSSDMFFSENAAVLTSAEEAKGGDIIVSAENITLIDGTLISSESSGTGDAGDIHFSATDTFFLADSAVTTEAKAADGGNIKVYAEYMIHLMDSQISASVGGGVETVGGNISIDPEYVLLDNSSIVANAYEGMGGNIDIVADVCLLDPSSSVDASSALGIDGSVDIRAPITEVSGTLTPLREDFKSALALLREPCVARLQRGKYSSFILRGREGLPIEPGNLLPSPLY